MSRENLLFEYADRAANQRLCLRYIASIIIILHELEISSLLPSSVAAQPGVCRNPEDRFCRDAAHISL